MKNYSELSLDREALENCIPLDAPFTVFVEATNVCNFKCPHCPHGLEDYRQQAGYYEAMSMELFSKLLTGIEELGHIKALKFWLIGEPFLNRHLAEMIRLAATAKVADRIELVSNGSLPMESVLDTGVDYVTISVYDRNEKVLNNVRSLQRNRGARELTKPLIFARLLTDGDAELEQWFKEHYGQCTDELGFAQKHNWAATFEFSDKRPEKHACPYPFYTLAVKANGDVVPCCVAWDKALTVGSLREQTLAEIWRGAPLRDLQRAHLDHQRNSVKFCANCDVLNLAPDNIDNLSLAEFERRLQSSK